MAVAFNNTNTAARQAGGSFSSSFSVTAGGSNIVAFAVLAWDGGTTSAAVTSITFGGNTMTSCGAAATNGTDSGLLTQVFYLVNPPTGASTLAVSVSNTPTEIYANVVSFTGVNQSTPVRPSTYQSTVSQGSGANNFFSMTITSNASDLTLSAISDDTGITGTNQTQDGSNTTGVAEMFHDHATTAATSVTHTWTFAATTVSLSMVGFSIQAAGGAAATLVPGIFSNPVDPLSIVSY